MYELFAQRRTSRTLFLCNCLKNTHKILSFLNFGLIEFLQITRNKAICERVRAKNESTESKQ